LSVFVFCIEKGDLQICACTKQWDNTKDKDWMVVITKW